MAKSNTRSDFTTSSRVIHKGPLEIHGVLLAGDSAGVDCQVYDGESTKGLLKCHLEALTGTSFSWGPHLGVTFRKGLYIAVSSNSARVTVVYEPLSRKRSI